MRFETIEKRKKEAKKQNSVGSGVNVSGHSVGRTVIPLVGADGRTFGETNYSDTGLNLPT